MNTPTIREELGKLRQTGKKEFMAIADAVSSYLDTEDPAAVGLLLPFANEYALRNLAQAARNPEDTDSRRMLDFVAIAMKSGDSPFPVVRDAQSSTGGQQQSAAEDFAATFLGGFLSRYLSYAASAEPAAIQLIQATDRQNVGHLRLASCLMGSLANLMSFGWTENSEQTIYSGWGFNVANSRDIPPNSDSEMTTLDRVVWDLPDDSMMALLRRLEDGPKIRYGEFFMYCRKLHGTLAALRPSLLERFIAEATPTQLGTLNWKMIVRATDAFDCEAIAYARSRDDSEALHLLVLIDGLRPGTCTDLALQRVFEDDLIPDESGLCYLRDQHPEQLADYFKRCCPKLSKFSELSTEALRTSHLELAKHWDTGGKESAMQFAREPLVATNNYSNGKASIQGIAFRGFLEASIPPPAVDLNEYLALAEKAIEAAPLKSQDMLETRRYFYLAITELHPELFVDALWDLFSDRSKILRDLAIDGLVKVGAGEVLPQAIQQLGASKADVRSSAANLLERLAAPSASECLSTALEAETSDKVRDALHKAVEACGGTPVAGAVEQPETSLADIEKAAGKMGFQKTGLHNLSNLPTLQTADGAELSANLVTYLIAKQAKQKVIEAAPDLLPLLALIDRERSAPFAAALVEGFLNSEQAASDRWALTLGGLLGDNRIINLLLPRIQGWCENSRHKLAEYAAQAISLLPGNEPLMVLDTLANRYRTKFKNIGRACSEAFNAAATARGITADELGDMVVPDFGFDAEGVRRFDWEGGGISAELGADFKLTWFDPETEKSWKTIPAGAPDETKAEVKTVTKLIRETVKAQTARLEMSLVRQRRWPVARWRELYEEHPLLRSFASGLVWGVYDVSGNLLRTFRRYPNGILADAAGAMEELTETDANIGMVHPLELDQPAIDLWRAHLQRMKVKQAFPQIDRPVELMDPLHGNRREISLTKDRKLSAGTFRSRAEKRGWTRGSVIDAGGIASYYKLYPGAGVEVNLPLDGFYIGCDPMDTIELSAAYFVTAGTVERGSYMYDDPAPDDPRVLRFDKVPPVVFSETISDLKAIIATKEQ